MTSQREYLYASFCAKSQNLKATGEYPTDPQTTVGQLEQMYQQKYGEGCYQLYPKAESSTESLQEYEARTPRFGLAKFHSLQMPLEDLIRREEEFKLQLEFLKTQMETMEAKIEAKVEAKVEAKMEARIEAQVEAKEQEMEARIEAKMEAKEQEMEVAMSKLKNDLWVFQQDAVTVGLGNLVVAALRKYHKLASSGPEPENREALSSESLVNFLAKSTPKEVERVSGNELKPGDYARLNDLKLIRERNALAHENWGKLAMILDTQEYSMHKQNYSRIFAWVVKSSIEEAAAEYASQRQNPESWFN